jgi:signal transduction histidine kinase
MAVEKNLLDKLAMGVLVLDANGQEVYRTPRVEGLVSGTGLAEPERFVRRVASLVSRAQASGNDEVENFEAPEATGGVRLTAAPLADGGSAVTFAPLTQSGDVEQRVRQFVSHVTHDLRTPLTSMLGASDLLLSGRIGEVDERHARLLRIVGEGTQRMAALLTEICEKYVEESEASQ